MFPQSVFYDTANLPVNVLTLVDEDFYSFVQERLGDCQSELLKIQQINSVPCFLFTDDPCQILNLNIDDHEVKLLKKQICFLLSDGSFVLKPGVKNGFKCLRDILTKKTEEKLKQRRASKTQLAPSHPTDSSLSPPLFSTPLLGITTSTVSTTGIVTSAPNSITVPTNQGVPMTSLIDHRKYFLNLLQQWCSEHQDEFMLGPFHLKEGQDFILNVCFDQNGTVQANIKCNWHRRIVLWMKGRKIQLSNFQKHLRTFSCGHIKEMQKKFQEQQKLDSQQPSINSISSITAGLPVTTTQDLPHQPATPSSINPSSNVNSSSATVVTTRSTISSRKRGQTSSQSNSSQKTKRQRV